MHENQVSVIIPATSANLGPGFDCLGLALGLYNRVTITAVPDQPALLEIESTGVDEQKVPRDGSNLIVQTAHHIYEQLHLPAPGFVIHQHNQIPVGSGLGSSSTAVLAGLFAANALNDNPFTRRQLLQFATDFEGHPDNVAPALFGGLVLGVQGENGLHVEQIGIPPLRVVYVLPDFELLTETARAALPTHVPRADAIFNASRVGLLIRALQLADYEKLALAMDDRLHQPYRMPLVPGMAAAFEAAQTAGAASVAISGAGPSVIAFAEEGHEEIKTAVMQAFASAGLTSRAWILPIDTLGTRMADES